MTLGEALFVFFLGLILGSFLNVIIYRLPRKESLIFPFSYCPRCKTPLKWYHNLPLLGFLFLKGRCAFCQERISLRYPLVEVLSSLLLITLYFQFKAPYGWITFFLLSFFGLNLLCISFIDLEYKEIPDSLNFSLIIAGWLLALLGKSPLNLNFFESLLSSFAGMGLLFFINEVYYLLTKRDGLGMGDFKLMGGLGSFLGYKSFFYILFYASLLGIIAFFLAQGLLKRELSLSSSTLKKEIPFGPFLSIAGIIYLFYPQSLL